MTRFAQPRGVSGAAVRRHLVDALRLMLRTWATRDSLAEMTDRELDDIGISRKTALAEARRMPWDITPVSRSG
jgi:uncharacterized protein YjiS (DUF1127 family)